MDTKLRSVNLIRFYREDDGSWYADVKGHTKGENKMVAGSDKFLESILKFNQDTGDYFDDILMTVATEEPEDYYIKLRRVWHDRFGATYRISLNKNKYCSQKLPKLCWLCNVTHTVLGEHPKTIYIVAF